MNFASPVKTTIDLMASGEKLTRVALVVRAQRR